MLFIYNQKIIKKKYLKKHKIQLFVKLNKNERKQSSTQRWEKKTKIKKNNNSQPPNFNAFDDASSSCWFGIGTLAAILLHGVYDLSLTLNENAVYFVFCVLCVIVHHINQT